MLWRLFCLQQMSVHWYLTSALSYEISCTLIAKYGANVASISTLQYIPNDSYVGSDVHLEYQIQ